MNFDIDQILNDMADAISGTLKNGAEDIKLSVKEIMNTEKNSLMELGEARLRGQIDEETFDREIEREKQVVEAELLTTQIMTKAVAQEAVNAAINIFIKAVKAAI